MHKITFLLFVLYSFSSFGQSIYEKALNLYENQRYEEAIPLFKDYLTEFNDEDKTLEVERYLAMSYLKIDNYENAFNWANKILEKDSLNETGLLIILKVGIFEKDVQLLYKSTNTLIEHLGVKEFHTYYYRGLSNIEFGNYELAYDDMIKAYAIDTDSPGLNYHLGLINFHLDNFEDAIPFFYKSIDFGYNLDDSYFSVASSYFNMEDFEKALRFLKIVDKEYPEYPSKNEYNLEFLYMFGESYFSLGDYKNAVHYLEQVNDKEFKDYERVFRITGLAYDELAKFYSQKEEYEKAAYFFAKKAEHIFNEGYIEDGLNHIDKAISLDSSIHYTLFKSQVMIFKIIYYLNESVFENYDEALSYSRKAFELVYQVYADIFAIDPENEYYLNRYIEDLYFFNKLFNEPEIIGEICETYDKLESYDYDFDKKIRSSLCFNTGEKTIIDYDVMLFELESFEERFGVSLIEDE